MINLRKLNKLIIDSKELDINLIISELRSDIIRLYNIEGASDDIIKFIINYTIDKGNIRTFKNYIDKCGVNNFDIERYKNYIEFRKTNFYDSSSEEFFKLVYGVDSYLDKFKERKLNKNNVYDPNYISSRDNISIEEAINKIDQYKKDKATSLDGFIKRHGVEEGNKMFIKFQDTSKQTLEKFQIRYGEIEGSKKYEEYKKSKDSMSINWALKKTNGDIKLSEELIKKRKDDTRVDFNSILKKFNDDIKSSILYYNNLNEQKANKKYTSKESLEILKPLFDKLISMGYEREHLYLGDVTLEKYFYDIDYNRGYFYDFTNIIDKYIIEYNGDYFHPRYEKYSIDEIMKKHRYFYDVEEKIEYDKRKINFAEQIGYNVLILWSEDGVDFNIKKGLEFIKNKNKNK